MVKTYTQKWETGNQKSKAFTYEKNGKIFITGHDHIIFSGLLNTANKLILLHALRHGTFYSRFVSWSTTFHTCVRHAIWPVRSRSIFSYVSSAYIVLAYIESGDREVTRPLSESSVHDDSHDLTNMRTARS